uniref:Docking protein 2 n=1 Tax=Chelonoidis abingdonii TaxID=106734 RepID=A0A8C0IYM3_CHEAB
GRGRGRQQGFVFMALTQKWRKFWAVLHRESACSCAHLELFEGSGPPTSEKPKKAESGKKLIKLSNCVHVAEANGDTSSPKETVAFILETTDKRYLLAAESTEVANWVLTLCDLAFAVRKAAVGKDSHSVSLSMEENSLYSSRAKATATKEFQVTVRATEATERCRLWGSFILRAEEEALELQDLQTGGMLYTWPYKFLRRFGRDKVTFSFEAGRRCTSGEGNFEFETTQGNEIFQVIESAINVQRGLGAEEPRWVSPADDALRLPYAEPCDSLRLPLQGRGPESEYAVPFDTIAKSLMATEFGSFLCGFEEPEVPYVLYDSIDEVGVRKRSQPPTQTKPEHIYDEPEGLSAHTVYDEPEEVKGEAWKLQATAEDPMAMPTLPPLAGQGGDWIGETEYDNVALRFMNKKKNVQ